MEPISITDFTAELRRYFYADELDDAAIAPLYARWQLLEGDAPRWRGLRSTIGGGAAEVGRGLAWYEALGDRTMPTALEVARAAVAIDTGMRGAPTPRAYCPDWLCGTWRRAAIAEDGLRFAPADGEVEWTLSADGTMATRGDPDLHGAGWRLHLGASPQLMVRAPGTIRWRPWIVARNDNDELDVIPAGATHRQLRFARV